MNINAEEYFKLKYLNRVNSIVELYKSSILPKDRVYKIKEINSNNPVNKMSIKDKLENNGISYNESKKKCEENYSEYIAYYNKYFNPDRAWFFSDPAKLKQWIDKQNDCCGYCGISKEELEEIALKRGKDQGLLTGKKNLTLNNGKKRSQGTLEIERLEPTDKKDDKFGYLLENCILACPLCNNAKSNLIDEKGWRKNFVVPMRNYYESILNKSLKNSIPSNTLEVIGNKQT